MGARKIDRLDGIDSACSSADLLKCFFVMLGHGRFALVDYDDAPLVVSITWRLHTGGYAMSKDDNRDNLYLHRFIMQPSEGLEVDHVNGDKLDNRRCNLRICTSALNKGNTNRKSHNVASRFKGVRKSKNGEMFYGRGIKDGKEFWLGAYATDTEAAVAYNKWAVETFGPFAKLNQI